MTSPPPKSTWSWWPTTMMFPEASNAAPVRVAQWAFFDQRWFPSRSYLARNVQFEPEGSSVPPPKSIGAVKVPATNTSPLAATATAPGYTGPSSVLTHGPHFPALQAPLAQSSANAHFLSFTHGAQ